jgi:hypothetical protein
MSYASGAMRRLRTAVLLVCLFVVPTASAYGPSGMRMSTALNRCEPAVVVAFGDEGSHATYRVPRLLC